MLKIINLETVDTKKSKGKVVKWIKENLLDNLLIDLPISWQTLIDDITQRIDPNATIAQMKDKGILKEPEDTHLLHAYCPLFDCLPIIHAQGVPIFCYISDLYHVASRDLSVEILMMTLRAKLGKIYPQRWRQVIEENVRLELECGIQEANFISKKIGRTNICLDASEEVVGHLVSFGYEVDCIEIDKSFKPMDILKCKIKREIIQGIEVSIKEVLELVTDHIRFTNLVLRKDYDSAYEIWRGVYQIKK